MKKSALLDKLYRRQGGKCYYCQQSMVRSKRQLPNTCTDDHKLPVSRGGTDAFDNRAACCHTCNQLKGPLTHIEFMELRGKTAELEALKRKVYAELNYPKLDGNADFYGNVDWDSYGRGNHDPQDNS